MNLAHCSKFAFESVFETHLLQNDYVPIDREGSDRERAISPRMVPDFIREAQPKEWEKIEALHSDTTGEQILGDLYKWMDQNGLRSCVMVSCVKDILRGVLQGCGSDRAD